MKRLKLFIIFRLLISLVGAKSISPFEFQSFRLAKGRLSPLSMLSQPVCTLLPLVLETSATWVHVPFHAVVSQQHSHHAAPLKETVNKDFVVQKCLSVVESRVDAFLTQFYGFDHSAIPFNYIDEPPSSLATVEENLGILLHCLTDLFLPTSAIRLRLMMDLQKEIYENYLTPLMRHLQSTLACASLTLRERIALEKDLAHLKKMEQMESTFLLEDTNRSPGPSDIVPVSGLVASRIHRLENESRTVISHWKRPVH